MLVAINRGFHFWEYGELSATRHCWFRGSLSLPQTFGLDQLEFDYGAENSVRKVREIISAWKQL